MWKSVAFCNSGIRNDSNDYNDYAYDDDDGETYEVGLRFDA